MSSFQQVSLFIENTAARSWDRGYFFFSSSMIFYTIALLVKKKLSSQDKGISS